LVLESSVDIEASNVTGHVQVVRTPSHEPVIHPSSPNPLGRYPLTLPRARLAQRVVSSLWRHDYYDEFFGGSPRQEFGLAGDVCEL